MLKSNVHQLHMLYFLYFSWWTISSDTKIKCAVLVTNVGSDLIDNSESAHKKIRNSVGVEGRGGGSKCQIYLLSALVGGIPQLSARIVLYNLKMKEASLLL